MNKVLLVISFVFLLQSNICVSFPMISMGPGRGDKVRPIRRGRELRIIKSGSMGSVLDMLARLRGSKKVTNADVTMVVEFSAGERPPTPMPGLSRNENRFRKHAWEEDGRGGG